MNDKTKRQSRKINALDVAIIALILIISCSAITFFVLRKEDKTPLKKVQIIYTVKVPNQSSELIEDIEIVGDKVYDKKREKELGSIIFHETVSSCVLFKKLDNGNALFNSVEGKKDLIVQIEADAYLVPEGYNINGYILTVGDRFDIYNPAYVFEGGYCVSAIIIAEEEEIKG